MKRLSSDICNLEARMRKKAAFDLKVELEHQEKLKQAASKKVKIDDSGKLLFCLESLPPNMFHLGKDNFASIAFFLGHTRVHIRKFITDSEGFLHPSRQGVSLSPLVWHSFQEKSYNFVDDILVSEKDLYISREKKDGEFIYILQRMFQRKNLSFQFIPDSVILTQREMHRLRDYIPQINLKLQEHLIKDTLAHFVSHEHSQHSEVENSNDSILYCDFHDYANLIHSLSQCLCKALSLKIMDIFICFGCESGYPKPDFHDCEFQSNAEKLDKYFELSFYMLDWRLIAKNFYNENATEFHVLSPGEFFSSLDAMSLISDVKKLYIET